MKSPNPVTCALMALGLLVVFPASATEMYYKGDLPGGVTNCQNYCLRSNLSPAERYDRLPGPDDTIVIVGKNMTIDLDDGHFDFLGNIKGIDLKQSENFCCNLHIEQDQTLPCWIADYSGYGSCRTGWLVKTGPGNLQLCTNLTSTTTGGMRMSFDVRQGDLLIRRPYPTASSVTVKNLRVAEGCTIHAPTGTLVSISTLSGAGTFTNDGTEPNGKNNDLYIGDDSRETEPTVFSGRLRGRWYVVNLNGYTYFTGTNNDFIGTTRGYSSKVDNLSDVRALGFVSFPPSGVSSLGQDTLIDNREGPLRLRYLGTEATTAGRRITVNDTTVGPTTIDGGQWGGLTWSAYFDLVTVGSNVGRQQRVAFSGTNAGERCVFTSYFGSRTANGTNYSFHVTKDGPGVWRFVQNNSNPWRNALTVRDGTLEFETIAETNKICALGYATECYPDVCDYTPNLTPVDWAWRLGDAANTSVTGTLQYVGAKDMQLTSRKTAVAGAGRFRFGSGSLFKYTAGICGLGAGEKTMCFESLAGATNVISDVSDGDGTVSVVKEGVGATVLTGGLGFSGDLRVDAGDLVLKDINNADYRYYRINFKENVSTSTHPGLNAYRTQFPTLQSAIRVTAFGFYSAAGYRMFTDPGDTNVNYLALQPGHGQVSGFADELAFYYNPNYGGILGGVQRLFGDNCAAGTVFQPEWRNGLKPTPGNPDSWYRLYLHLADDKATPVSWDMCYNEKTNSARYAMNVTALSIDASADGATWQEVAATNNIVHLYDAANCWLSNPPETEWDSSVVNYPERQSHPNKFPLSATKQQGTYARPTPRSVFVRRGATLRNESATKIQISGLALDKSGMGTLEGFSLSASGTLSIEGLADERTVTIPADFSTVSGYENLADWTLVVNGVPSKKYMIAGVTENGITLTKHGLMLIVR